MKIQKNKALSQMSTDVQMKRYFHRVLKLRAQNEEFPVILDDIWPLVYQRKEEAVRALKRTDIFIEGIDYVSYRKNKKKPKSGRPEEIYKLTVKCMEYFIVRRNRMVFDIYHKIFDEIFDKTFGVDMNSSLIKSFPEL